jgi:hypothetical protein
MNAHVTNLLQKEMSRKEFLAAMALAGGSVLGLSSIIKLTTGKSLQSALGGQQLSGQQSLRANTYGANPYGH